MHSGEIIESGFPVEPEATEEADKHSGKKGDIGLPVEPEAIEEGEKHLEYGLIVLVFESSDRVSSESTIAHSSTRARSASDRGLPVEPEAIDETEQQFEY